MLKIKIICVGNLKEKFYKDAYAEFEKRLTRFCSLTLIELPEKNNKKNTNVIIDSESELIIQKLSGYKILLDINGESCSSTEFASTISKLSLNNSELTFIIGGSYGVCDKLKNICDYKLSFSKMTFNHNLFRVMLVEQLYRAFSILENGNYHK
ncbi:MAG: 23S rRNA (pseudouridine(1915)-N(3))-methyltransferase RlmH [Clostridia bacterium]